MIVNGTGGAASSASLHDRGVVVELGGRITSTGIGNVSVTGTGPATGHQQIGVYMGDGSTIDSAGGNVSVTGYGGTGTSGECDGVFMDFGTNLITAGGSGTVTVVGTAGGSATAQGANGVDVRRIGSSIRSSGGNASVTGTGGTSNTTSLGGNAGVQVMGDGVIAAGGTGTTTVTGIGGTASGIGAEGVVVDVPRIAFVTQKPLNFRDKVIFALCATLIGRQLGIVLGLGSRNAGKLKKGEPSEKMRW